jgi:hypothetical protein
MPLQNRINPFGQIIATSERGAWTGNRGIIHNDRKEIVKNYALKPWITCALEYKGMHRIVMTPKRWTELFFLDEATAFAAGHRPCGYCRHADFKRFKSLWLQCNGAQYNFSEKTKMSVIDEIIHQERLDENGEKRTYNSFLTTLPDGAFITFEDKNKSYLWYQENIYEWSFGGYTKFYNFEKNQEVNVLTPRSYVAVLKAGYVPQVNLKSKKSN